MDPRQTHEARALLSDRDKSISARAELSKIGLATVLDAQYDDRTPRADLLKLRGDMRRAMNALVDQSQRIPSDEALPPALRGAIEYVAAAADLLSARIDANEAIGLTATGLAGSTWRDQQGNPVAVYAPNESVSDGRRNDGVTFGGFVKALATGSRDPGIRAALGESAIGTGGATVPTHLLRELIDAMRARQVCVASGARTVILETEKTSIARLDTDPAASWRLENAAVTESDPTFSAITFQARSLAVLVKVSFELLQDSVNIDGALMNAFAQAMALQLDGVALTGTGTAPQPRGIWNTTGVNALTPGAAIDYGDLLDAVLEMKEANSADPTAVILNPADWRILAGLADTTGQPLVPPPAVAGIPQRTTTGIPAKNLIVGDFTQLMIGVRSQMRVEVLREAFMSNLQIGFIAHLRADVQVAQPKSFCKITTT